MESSRALVVGATGGIGRRVAVALAGPGRELIVHGRVADDRIDRLVEEVEAAGGAARKLITPIEHAENITEELDALLPLDILVVSFGPLMRAPVADTAVTDWRRMAELNLVMPAALVSACLPSMMERNYGRILLFGGTGTDRLRGYATIAAYSAAKTGLATVVKSTARQVADYDIRINAICPGYVDTEYYGEDERARARRVAPGGRMLAAEEVAGMAAYLLRPENTSISGAVVPMDGGLA
jgi:NAD(P)-dependent dehydrogenase (short-subunit alcohol dehydrogenase family)